MKGRIFASVSGLITFAGVFLLILWGFRYNFSFGACKIKSYNLEPGLNCDFASIFCDTSYCSNLYVSFTDGISNYTGLVPVTFEEDYLGYRDCWNFIPYSNLKAKLKDRYPIGSKTLCYADFKNQLVFSNYSFYKLSQSLRVSGIILTVIGVSFLLIYFIHSAIVRSVKKPVYEVI